MNDYKNRLGADTCTLSTNFIILVLPEQQIIMVHNI